MSYPRHAKKLNNKKAVQIRSLNVTACHAEFDGLLSDLCVCFGRLVP